MFVKQGANSYKELSLQLEVSKEGAKYAIVYLANESPTNVYFDDLKIEHQQLVWQENSYYPFGMGIKPLDYEPTTASKFTYMGVEKEEATDFHETDHRSYDSQLGRTHQTDKLAELFSGATPYHYCLNNPIRFSDPSGLSPQDPTTEELVQQAWDATSEGGSSTFNSNDDGTFTSYFLVGRTKSDSHGNYEDDNAEYSPVYDATTIGHKKQSTFSYNFQSPFLESNQVVEMGMPLGETTRNFWTGASIVLESSAWRHEASLTKRLANGAIKSPLRHVAKLKIGMLKGVGRSLMGVGAFLALWEAYDKGFTNGATTMLAVDTVMLFVGAYFPPIGIAYGITRLALDLAGYDLANIIDENLE